MSPEWMTKTPCATGLAVKTDTTDKFDNSDLAGSFDFLQGQPPGLNNFSTGFCKLAAKYILLPSVLECKRMHSIRIRRFLTVEYRNLVNKGADHTEFQSFLSQGDMVTTTILISANLKQTVSEEATLQGMSFSAFMRRCAIQCLSEDERR